MMFRVNSFRIKKYTFYFAILLVVGSLVSLASTAFFTNKVVNQLKELNVDQPLVRAKQVQNLSASIHLLNISVSNPFFALTTLVATTPQTFLPTSRALRSADQFVSSTADFLQTQKQGEFKTVDAVAHFDASLPDLNNTLKALSQVRFGGLFTPLDKRLRQIRSEASSLHDATTAIAPILRIFPGISGQSSPRNYLIAFQNSAEARGTGGILGAYAVMNINKGKAKFSAFGSNAGLTQLQDTPIKMSDEFVRLYNDDPGIWQNSNISPHFPYGAEIWLALWKNQFNQQLDGVLTFDPAALSYLLKATGPIEVDGEIIDSNNVVQVTLSDVYKKYVTDNDSRKRFLIEIIKAVSQKIEDKEFKVNELAVQLIQPLNQHRILFYSTKVEEQEILEKSKISGSVSGELDNQYRLVIQNTSGNKMDYYLKRDLRLETLICGSKPQTRVTFTLTNTASVKEKLPSYVVGRLDLNRPSGVANSYGTRAIVFAPVGTRIISTTEAATKKKFGFLVKERGHTGVAVQVDLAAGQSQEFSIVFSGGKGALTSYVQPLVIDQKTAIIDRCTR
jgi:hypothetical protein